MGSVDCLYIRGTRQETLEMEDLAMKRSQGVLVLAGILVFFASGCASPKAVYQRGWIGGKYLESNPTFLKELSSNYFKTDQGVIPALPDVIKSQQSGGVFVSRTYDGTPAKEAGVREGDLIVRIDGRKVENVKDMRRLIDWSQPGTRLIMAVYRNGNVTDIPVVVGVERYQKEHYFSLGLGLGTEFDPIPHPEFNLLEIVKWEVNHTRVELKSPEYNYFQAVSQNHFGLLGNKVNFEGWDTRFLIFGLGGRKVVLSQDRAGS